MKKLPEKHIHLLHDIIEQLRTCTIYGYNQIHFMCGRGEINPEYFSIYAQYTKIILSAIFTSMSTMGFDLSSLEIPICNENAIAENTMLEAIEFSSSLEAVFGNCLELLGWDITYIDLSYGLNGCEEKDYETALQSVLDNHFPSRKEREAVEPLIALLDDLFPAYACICKMRHRTLGKYLKENPNGIWNNNIVPLMDLMTDCNAYTIIGDVYLAYCSFVNSDDYETFISPLNYNLQFIIQAIFLYDAMLE